MKSKDSITFGGITAEPGMKSSGMAPVLDTDYSIPVTVINGKEEGKTVLITSSIHGCEYPSIEAVFRLAEELDPAVISGQVVIINPVNVTGFIERRPYILPEDGKNINRLFPGDPNGTLGDKIAFVLTEEYQKKADFHIDTHGGDIPETLSSYVYYPGVSAEEAGLTDPEILNKSEEALRVSEEAADYVLNAKYRIRSQSRNHAYTYAGIIGTPSLLLELGDNGTWSEEEVELYLENLRNLLRYLGVLPGDAVRKQEPARQITKGEYLAADHSGRWYPMVKKDEKIVKGQKLGEIRDLFGNVVSEFSAKYDGVVLMVVTTLAIKEGNDIVSYGA